MRWLVDEGVPKHLVDWLLGRGEDVLDVAESEHRGRPDEALWQLAGEQQRIVVTRDLGFLWPSLHPVPVGVVIIRVPSQWRAAQITSLVQGALEDATLSSLQGNVTLVEPGRIRQRSLSHVNARTRRGL